MLFLLGQTFSSGCLRDSFGLGASSYALLVKTQLRLSPNRSRTFPVPFLYLSACLDVSSLYLPSSYLLPTFFLPSFYLLPSRYFVFPKRTLRVIIVL